jgi:hypothetical protein
MAIVFSKELNELDLLFAYNNNNVIFSHDTVLTATRATVYLTDFDFQFTLYPDPSGNFHFNYKTAVSNLINQNNFADTSCFDLVTPIVNNFKARVISDGGTFESFDCLVQQIYDLGVDPIIAWTDEIFKYTNVVYTIYFSNNTTNTITKSYEFLSAYVNYQNFKKLYPSFPYPVTTEMMLKPIPYLKYWSGYPFDITFYNGEMSDLNIGTITNIGQTFSLRNPIWEVNTITPNIGCFSNGTPSFNGSVGDDVTFYYNRPTDNDILSSIRENDIISMSNSSIGTWVYSVNSISKTGGIYAINLKIVTIGTIVSPINGSIISNSITLANGLINTETYTNENRIIRVVISNGNEFINLERGYNNFLINNVSIQIEKITGHCNGHYIKWLNSFGGWNYWLFYKGNDTLTTKDLGQIYNDYNDVVDTVSPYISIGKTSENNIAVRQDDITENEMQILNDLLDSPKVYLFTGEPNENATCHDWLEVNIKAGSFRVSSSREKMNNLNLTIEIPTNTTKIL